jgi:hypothetical protein
MQFLQIWKIAVEDRREDREFWPGIISTPDVESFQVGRGKIQCFICDAVHSNVRVECLESIKFFGELFYDPTINGTRRWPSCHYSDPDRRWSGTNKEFRGNSKHPVRIWSFGAVERYVDVTPAGTLQSISGDILSSRWQPTGNCCGRLLNWGRCRVYDA